MANVRYQLLQDVYMPLDGQWQIVLSGSVFDVPDTTIFAPAHVNKLSPGEPAGNPVNSKPTSVRGIRTR